MKDMKTRGFFLILLVAGLFWSCGNANNSRSDRPVNSAFVSSNETPDVVQQAAEDTQEEQVEEATSGEHYDQSGHDDATASQSKGFLFRNSQDVMIYTMGHEFTDGEITIRFRENGIFANGQCMTFAPTVSDFDGYHAIVTAMDPQHNRYTFIVDSSDGTVTDQRDGTVYRCR